MPKGVKKPKRCDSGVACAPVDWDAVSKLGKRAAKWASEERFVNQRIADQQAYAPLGETTCDACVLAEYRLETSSGGGCPCCNDDMYSQADVLRVLRELRTELEAAYNQVDGG